MKMPFRGTTRLSIALLFILTLIALTAGFAPVEKTLGKSIRLVYFHGAWVWAGLITFGVAALVGLPGLIARGNSRRWAGWSLALGRAGLFFWLTYLPMSLLIMQVYWGGFFLSEPRWRIPFAFGVTAVLLQLGLAIMKTDWLICAGNLLFGAALWYSLARAEEILHPDSPVFQSGSPRIQLFFVALVALSLVFGGLLAALFKRLGSSRGYN